MTQNREDPDKILGRIKEAQLRSERGKLKVYLGAAPGVGKTYAMLQDALEQRSQGLDVIVGVVETHGRNEVNSLLKGFEILPKQTVTYRDKKLLEFDLDAALRRSPSLILMDEMAHTNMPGLRHEKRWQDIKELLDRGIDVYTTLNVQHIESLSDKVSELIHAPIKETIPDSMLELANSIELVDLSPEDLLKRLEDGKVYFHENAQKAKNHFFRKINLIALRELALRVAAEHVAAEVVSYRKHEGIKEGWSTKENILVCVSASPEATKLIRIGKQLATRFKTQWIAVHVASPNNELLSKQQAGAIQNLRFAEYLGAKTHIINSYNIAKELIEFALENNITLIVIKKRTSTSWKDWFSQRLADQIIHYSGTINVYVVSDTMGEPVGLQHETLSIPNAKVSLWKWQDWKGYLMAISVVILISALGIGLNFIGFSSLSNVLMLYFLGVIAVAALGMMGPAIVAATLSVIVYFIIFSPQIQYKEYFLTFIIFFIVAQVISRLKFSIQQQNEATHFLEHQRIAVYDLNHQLANLVGREKILEAAVTYLARIFDSQILALGYEKEALVILAHTGTEKVLTEKEKSIGHWVCKLGQMAGLGTNTLSSSDALYLPFLGSKNTLGVLRVHPFESNLLTPEQIGLLQACAKQIALILESDSIYEQKKQMELQLEIDRIRSALLQYVSQDLRAPLAAIFALIKTIKDAHYKLTPIQIKDLGDNLEVQNQELDQLINNLFKITYLEIGSLALQKNPCSIKILLENIIKIEKDKWKDQEIQINVPEYLPKINLDALLIQEVFINIIDNAIQCSPANTVIIIEAALEDNKIIISVRDHGSGIVPEEADKIFEKFYRGTMLRPHKGLGLGLSICRKIIDAHGGSIWTENAKEGGAIIRFILPVTSN